MRKTVRIALTCLLSADACLSGAAQDSFRVLSVSQRGAVSLEDAGGESRALSVGEFVDAGALLVNDGARAMLSSLSGPSLVVIGPAKAQINAGEDRTSVVLADGWLIVAATDVSADFPPMTLAAPKQQSSDYAVDMPIRMGTTYLNRHGARVNLAYVSDADGALPVNVSGAASSLPSGKWLVIDGDSVEIRDAGPWIDDSFEPDYAELLGLASAQQVRVGVGQRLFENIVTWDQRGGSEYVKGKIDTGRFNPEIRTVAVSISTPTRPLAKGASVSPTVSFPAANEVPPLSPAALSVVNLGEGVTAILLNRQARGLLEANGSQGLGFAGPRLLAIPGFFGGIRTIGPPGLGAQSAFRHLKRLR